jgi:hypothetical protein
MASTTITVKTADWPEVKAALEHAAAEIAALKVERDEWEQRYEDLLGVRRGVARMTRWSPWAICGICVAVTLGTVEAYVGHLLEERRVLQGLFPKGWSE